MMSRRMNSLDLSMLRSYAMHVRPELEVSTNEQSKGIHTVVVDGFNGPEDLHEFSQKLETRTGVKL